MYTCNCRDAEWMSVVEGEPGPTWDAVNEINCLGQVPTTWAPRSLSVPGTCTSTRGEGARGWWRVAGVEGKEKVPRTRTVSDFVVAFADHTTSAQTPSGFSFDNTMKTEVR